MIKGTFLYLLIVAIAGVHGECPADELVKPCVCRDDEHIVCEGDKHQDFCKMFAHLSKKLNEKERDLELFVLSNKAVEEIPDKCFDDIYFKEIRIENAVNLKKIHANAFAGTQEGTEKLTLLNCPKLEAHNYLFDILNKFKKLEELTIGNIGLKEIPANAFKPMELYWLWISGPEITKIGEKAFFHLNSLTEFHITKTGITEIHDGVFVFSKPSTAPLDLCLYNNPQLTKFDDNAFSNTGRPTDVDFSGERFVDDIYPKQMAVLEERVFKKHLENNEENKIDMTKQHLDCNDCRNAWLKKHPKLLERVVNVKCADGKDVKDSFGSC